MTKKLISYDDEVEGLGLPDVVEQRLEKKFATQPVEIEAVEDFAYVVTTEDGKLLLGFRKDGTIESPGLPQGGGTVGGEVQDRWLAPDGTIAKTHADTSKVTGWGSSSLEGMAPELTATLSPLGVAYSNQSKGGERIEHVAARMGAVPAIISPVTIPASGGVTVTSTNLPPVQYALPFNGTLAGVPGRITYTASTLTFARATGGDPVTITEPAEFIPDVDPGIRGAVTIISAGKNNLDMDGAVELVLDYTDRLVRYLTPLYPRVLVMGHFIDANTPVGGQEYRQILEANAALAARYGDYFVDHLGILAGQDIWTRTGITPTEADRDMQETLRLPPSLARDNAHHNNIADTAIAAIIVEQMTTLGWY